MFILLGVAMMLKAHRGRASHSRAYRGTGVESRGKNVPPASRAQGGRAEGAEPVKPSLFFQTPV